MQEPNDPGALYGTVPCPTDSLLIRSLSSNQSANQNEINYVLKRRQKVQEAWNQWLGDGADIGYIKTMSLADRPPPIIGIAMAGDGLRGTLFSAGVMNAFDSRNATSQRKGTGGLTGSTSFTTSSLGSSFFVREGFGFNPSSALIARSNNQGALLNMSLVAPGGADPFATNNQAFYDSILGNVQAKARAGFNASVVDIWGHMLTYHFLNGTTQDNFYTNDTLHGANNLWSGLVEEESFQNFSDPFPIVTLHSQGSDPSSALVYEISPYEMGSFDPRIAGMVQTKYLGTRFSNGAPSSNDSCVTGFDQSSFIMGTASSTFYNPTDGTNPNISGWDSDDANAFSYLLGRLKGEALSTRYDVGNVPNPFKGLNSGSFPDSDQESLNLGGAQNYLPIEQLLVKDRNVDIIVVLDSTGETTENKWPDGTSLQVAKQRVNTIFNQTHRPFPPIPGPNDFVQTGVNLRPTFFGCPNSTTDSPDWPLIIYIPNAPPADGSDPVTNPTGFKTSYTDLHQQVFIDQAYASATSGFVPNKTGADDNFPKCLQCAAVDRLRFSTSDVGFFVPRSEFCEGCLKQYCYDETNPPSINELPGRKLVFVSPDSGNNTTFFQRHRAQIIGGVIGAAILIIALILAFFFWRRRCFGVRRIRLPRHKVDSMGKYNRLFNARLSTGGDFSADPTSRSQAIEMPEHGVHYRDP